MDEEKQSPPEIDVARSMASLKAEVYLASDVLTERIAHIKELINDSRSPDLGAQFRLFRIWPFSQLSIPLMAVGRTLFNLYNENQRKGLNLLILELEIVNTVVKHLDYSMVKRPE